MSDKAWGGRFDEELDAVAARFSASVDFDRRLGEVDVRGSIAHVKMLAARGIVSAEDADAIVAGLETIRGEIERGEMRWDPANEDVHMNVEALLTERIGEAGGRLHTGRSRNDQVATDMRLWTREALGDTVARVDRFLAAIARRAPEHMDHLMPGYTHLQRAQPVRLSHHLMAWAEMLERDRGRMVDAARRLDECPLGSAALAGTTFDLDREATAEALGFARPTANSLDAVGDRDFLLETVSALSICAVHLSRVAEELVLWSTQEFGFVEMSDAFTTGSSIMPQKKNPDMAELVRGKTGRVVGHLVSLTMLMKALPLAYNRDMQEDKPPVFDAFDTVNDCLDVLTGCVAGARFDAARMREALKRGFVDATEVADWLAAHGVPFREAHHVTGRLVRRCLEAGTTLSDLTLEELREEHEAFDEGVFEALDPETAVERRDLTGGPARARVTEQVEALRARLGERGIEVG
ncbi:MAG TPA: argininosuccinate lyase [Sandaracinaceae bacterium LLY-WYZ-13_1]|nr:argininosuccinate lyase [Sandaracinaceae bacterium LLY-WYZ-13_1]